MPRSPRPVTRLTPPIAGQLALGAEDWGAPGPLRVRMGLHTGVAEVRDGDYYGGVLNRAARLMAIAHGGQIVASLATVELLRDDGYALVDLGEHRLRDLGRAEHVFQVTHPALAEEFPVLRSLESFPTNLPLQVTSFVGRSRELADVIDALDDNRIVTITGVGGVGKTRLALQTGAEALPRFPDGVWLCELGPLGNADLVPSVLAGALGVQQRAGQTMTESIVAACAHRNLLVVLDNCEHLLDAAARMVDVMVRSCPGVLVLATSREGLGVSGERIMVLRSLELPAESTSVTDATDIDAVRLFVDRAAATGSGFELVPGNVGPVVQICRRLDGIPLAIELAAARVRVMSTSEIAGLLDERFRLLAGGLRTTVERHQTLRQAVDWSYDLLDHRERQLLNRLGVFAGGFTLGAAAAVAGRRELDTFDVLDLLGQLVDKSLVVADDTSDGTRYRLLETIRQYALERLDDAGETDDVRQRARGVGGDVRGRRGVRMPRDREPPVGATLRGRDREPPRRAHVGSRRRRDRSRGSDARTHLLVLRVQLQARVRACSVGGDGAGDARHRSAPGPSRAPGIARARPPAPRPDACRDRRRRSRRSRCWEPKDGSRRRRGRRSS